MNQRALLRCELHNLNPPKRKLPSLGTQLETAKHNATSVKEGSFYFKDQMIDCISLSSSVCLSIFANLRIFFVLVEGGFYSVAWLKKKVHPQLFDCARFNFLKFSSFFFFLLFSIRCFSSFFLSPPPFSLQPFFSGCHLEHRILPTVRFTGE